MTKQDFPTTLQNIWKWPKAQGKTSPLTAYKQRLDCKSTTLREQHAIDIHLQSY